MWERGRTCSLPVKIKSQNKTVGIISRLEIKSQYLLSVTAIKLSLTSTKASSVHLIEESGSQNVKKNHFASSNEYSIVCYQVILLPQSLNEFMKQIDIFISRE